jgi:hypothetical protein
VSELERALFGGLGQLSALMERLARIEAPGIESLDPRLLRRFVSEQGVWRIEVMPRSGTGQLSFAAAVRRAVPEAAGEPMVSLSRNEIIHHETMLAIMMALALAAFLVLAALRNVTAGSGRWRRRGPSSPSLQPSPCCSASASMPRCWQG